MGQRLVAFSPRLSWQAAHALVVKEAKVRPALRTPAGVEATVRTSHRDEFLFLLNYKDRPVKVALGVHRGRDLVSGKTAARQITLPALGAAVIQDKA